MVDTTPGFFNEFGLQRHSAESLDLTINIVVAIHQTDIFDLSAGFDSLLDTFCREVFDGYHRIAILQRITIAVLIVLYFSIKQNCFLLTNNFVFLRQMGNYDTSIGY